MNTFGNIFRLTTAGESHGPAMTGIIDGMPAGIIIDTEEIQRQLDTRRPGFNTHISTARREPDHIKILSGVFDGKSTGAPIAFIIENVDAHSSDYTHIEHTFRPSHADFTYQTKYGIRDVHGGGRSSARETVVRVAGGAFALLALRTLGIDVHAYTSQIGSISINQSVDELDLSRIYDHPTRCPQQDAADRMETLVRHVREAGDTVGGVVSAIITGLPVGLGEPVYDKFHARLAAAMMSINAAKGFEYGMGFAGVGRLGSEMSDTFILTPDGKISTITNHSGGIQGGITNGRAVDFRVAFKPAPTLMREHQGITDTGEITTIKPKGRHDACIVPRAVPVVRAMAAMVALDAVLMAQTNHLQPF